MLFRRVSPVIPRIRLGRIPVVAVIRIGIDPILLGTVHLFGVFYAVAFMVAFRYGALPHVQQQAGGREAEALTTPVGARLAWAPT